MVSVWVFFHFQLASEDDLVANCGPFVTVSLSREFLGVELRVRGEHVLGNLCTCGTSLGVQWLRLCFQYRGCKFNLWLEN